MRLTRGDGESRFLECSPFWEEDPDGCPEYDIKLLFCSIVCSMPEELKRAKQNYK